jgi:glutamate synthase domain-containing protein 2
MDAVCVYVSTCGTKTIQVGVTTKKNQKSKNHYFPPQKSSEPCNNVIALFDSIIVVILTHLGWRTLHNKRIYAHISAVGVN